MGKVTQKSEAMPNRLTVANLTSIHYQCSHFGNDSHNSRVHLNSLLNGRKHAIIRSMNRMNCLKNILLQLNIASEILVTLNVTI